MEPTASTSAQNESELDFTSAEFDPLRALYSPTIPKPPKNVKIYDNLASFDIALSKFGVFNVGKRQKPTAKTESASEKPLPSESSAKSAIDASGKFLDIPHRKFLPHQALVPTVGIKMRHTKNLFSKIKEYSGPLGAIYDLMENKRPVKVYTRKLNGVRGITTGIIAIFDKNWNIVLTDVCEVWKRRKFEFSKNKICAGEAKDCTERLRNLGITLPEVQVKSLGRKTVECTRRCKQLLIRGEQIVLIAAAGKDE